MNRTHLAFDALIFVFVALWAIAFRMRRDVNARLAASEKIPIYMPHRVYRKMAGLHKQLYPSRSGRSQGKKPSRKVLRRLEQIEALPAHKQTTDPPQFRLRIGNWRYILRKSGEDAIEILRVRNRREAYR
jgi:hypothetical protein